MEPSQLSGDPLLLDNQLCFGLYAASRRVIHLYAPLLTRLDITYTQYITLLVLWEHRRLAVKAIGDSLMLDSGTLTPMLKKLEKKGLVTRRRSTEDERSVIVELTGTGAAMKEEALAFLPSLLCTSCLTPPELVELRELLHKLLHGLEEDAAPPA
ncbi:MAG: MarR family transcriptional regulator [Chloroflexi bacterium]|jgi:DNA-binding MarR family transcriptional regulator|nr:MarR family transcriptional regulator [Anaerolineaceae bacterium]NMB90822.1 MarR family transcriptional regulator [Chloroflexota bacterium]